MRDLDISVLRNRYHKIDLRSVRATKSVYDNYAIVATRLEADFTGKMVYRVCQRNNKNLLIYKRVTISKSSSKQASIKYLYTFECTYTARVQCKQIQKVIKCKIFWPKSLD